MTDYCNFTGFNWNLRLNEYKINKQQPQQQEVYFKLSKAYKACASNLAKAIWGGSTREKRKFEQKKWNGTLKIYLDFTRVKETFPDKMESFNEM